MLEFRMPSLGADMEAGTLVEWRIKPGDAVTRGQVVAVVETQKGAIDVEIWDSGIVDRLVARPGAKIPVGEVLALLRGDGKTAAPPATTPSAIAPTAVTAPVPSAAQSAADRQKISPSARRLAQELGVDLATVQAQTADGVISRADIERAAATAKPAAVAPAAGDWRAQMRKAIAAAMARAKREIPHYYLATDIDVTPLLAWLAAENAKRSVVERLLPAVPLMKAVALALREVPELNGFWIDGAFRPSSAVHLGMAIAMRGGGLVAPAIHDADRKTCDELMAALRDLITRVRGGRLRSSEMADPTVTLTSLGEQGVAQVFGVIYPPQVAIVGLGRIRERPWVTAGTVAVRQVLTASLAADHRVSDGHRGALFLAALDRLLQAPETLAEKA
ncbi:MAG: 2-oxo acid dehydrogenase subunit E2 [Betaproteobacteria bacterium]|nr:MAG: 2-oxo acid dehydrogenase subunit E2 [Betaproteobacteria bacterium]